MKQAVLAVCLMLVSCLPYCSTLRKEAVYLSETVEFHQTTQRCIPEDMGEVFPVLKLLSTAP
jgi:hypothetical protein